MSRRISPSLLLVVFVVTHLYALQGTALFWGASWKPNKGIHLVDVEAQTGRMILSEGTGTSIFAPDGRRILFQQGGDWYTIYNDGTGKELFYDGGLSPSMGTGIKWVNAGIFWQESGGGIWRLDPDTKQKTQVATVTGDYYQGLWITHDGRRCVVWTRNNETEHHYPLIDFTSDWSSYSVRWADVWGHGWHLVLDGSYVVVDDWRRVCNSTPVCTDYGSHLTFVVYDWDSVGPESSDGIVKSFPSNTDGEQVGTHDIHPCLNNNSYFAFMAGGCRWTPDENGCDDPQRAWVMNWETEQVTEIIGFPAHYMYIGGYWHGELPSPVATQPVISLDKSSLSFSDTGAAVPAQTVTVTNSGIGTLTKVDAAVTSGSAPWLTVTVEGSGGNTQTITNSVDASGLTAGAYSATVTVSGGGASNTRDYTVSLNVAMTLAAPTNLATSVGGDSLRDVTLTWVDNADGEEGYVVERRPDGGSWSEVGTAAADATSYVDSQVAPGSYTYRVRAQAGSEYSAYSAEAPVSVVGVPWVRLTAPATGDTLTAGASITIRWTTNQIDNVELHVSTDEGENWTPINPTGGISSTNPSWDNFSWMVPITMAGEVMLRIRMYQAPDYSHQTGALVVVPANAAGHARGTAVPGMSSLRTGGLFTLAGSARFVYDLAPGETGELWIMALDGTRVARVNLGDQPGRHVAVWDGRNGRGGEVGRGTYLARLMVECR
ncbi:MAG: hypothetical protein GF331_11895 [Chitinivibrionales bacterium]|nr:hypothetical protein [Chitinivibrionales bacterium]